MNVDRNIFPQTNLFSSWIIISLEARRLFQAKFQPRDFPRKGPITFDSDGDQSDGPCGTDLTGGQGQLGKLCFFLGG